MIIKYKRENTAQTQECHKNNNILLCVRNADCKRVSNITHDLEVWLIQNDNDSIFFSFFFFFGNPLSNNARLSTVCPLISLDSMFMYLDFQIAQISEPN